MKVVELSGGVGGAKMARGLAAFGVDLTVVVNVGDDADNHGLAVSPDLDTVLYTLAGLEGPQGWGRAGDTFNANDELERFGVDNTFRLGDRDLALKVVRTEMLRGGRPLSSAMEKLAQALNVSSRLLPVTDDRVRTEVEVADGWISFQEYFVNRRHRDDVLDLRYAGAQEASPAPGVLEAFDAADCVVIAPSNPPLSIWPIFAVPGIKDAVRTHPRVVAVSPLFGGQALRGPAHRVMAAMGLPAGNRGVLEAYQGFLNTLVIDEGDRADADDLKGVEVIVTDTRIGDVDAGKRLAKEILST